MLESNSKNLQQQFDKSIQILREKKQELHSKLTILDSYANSLNCSRDSLHVENDSPTEDEVRQDHQIRQVLDSIDLKIGQVIEDQETECQEMQIMQKTI